MSKYTTEYISRIINDCEILFLPDGESHESVEFINEASSTQILPKILRALNDNNETSETSSEEDFEKFFYASKLKKQIVEVS